MNAQDFTYWLQGFFEISGTNQLTEDQVKIIKDHLQLVFTKVTPKSPFKATATYDPTRTVDQEAIIHLHDNAEIYC